MEHISVANETPHTDPVFDNFSDVCNKNLQMGLNHGQSKLFCSNVDGDNLYEIYLKNLPQENRQYHSCSTCRDFIRRFGNLVVIDDLGGTVSAIWPGSEAPEYYRKASEAMRTAVTGSPIREAFYSQDRNWGVKATGQWTHFCVVPPKEFLMKKRGLETPFQKTALTTENFGTISRALAEFDIESCRQAVSLLRTNSLYNSPAVLGAAEFLLDIHEQTKYLNQVSRRNLIWKAIYNAPQGFCTPRSGMIGTLLEDIISGMSFERVSVRFAEKMHPLRRMRPQAAPSAGNIAMAEKMVKDLGVAPSLERRFARFEEIEKIWIQPIRKQTMEAGSGVFGHLRAKGARIMQPVESDRVQPITWARFVRDVLPHALQVEVKMARARMNFGAMVTAVNPDAPPIHQWDHEERRNPFSMYVYHGGSKPDDWNLPLSGWVNCPGITLYPALWHDPGKYAHLGNSACLLLDGAKDKRNHSMALFPSTLKSELHAIRSTVESFSKSRKLHGQEEASACGLFVGSSDKPHTIRVSTSLGRTNYHIDRWE